MRDKIIGMVRDALESKDRGMTWFYDLAVKDGKRWAFVLAWMDWDGTGEWNLYGKVAYQPVNSIMQCDYDFDWLTPCDKITEEVIDTETQITNVDFDTDWLLGEWEEIKNDLDI